MARTDGLPSTAGMLTPAGVGSVSTQLLPPGPVRPIDKSCACTPNATESSKAPPSVGRLNMKTSSPEEFRPKPVLREEAAVNDAGEPGSNGTTTTPPGP